MGVARTLSRLCCVGPSREVRVNLKRASKVVLILLLLTPVMCNRGCVPLAFVPGTVPGIVSGTVSTVIPVTVHGIVPGTVPGTVPDTVLFLVWCRCCFSLQDCINLGSTSARWFKYAA